MKVNGDSLASKIFNCISTEIAPHTNVTELMALEGLKYSTQVILTAFWPLTAPVASHFHCNVKEQRDRFSKHLSLCSTE